jgi:hypothetical protein
MRRCGHINLGKIISVTTKRVAVTFMAALTLPENSCFLTSSDYIGLAAMLYIVA